MKTFLILLATLFGLTASAAEVGWVPLNEGVAIEDSTSFGMFVLGYTDGNSNERQMIVAADKADMLAAVDALTMRVKAPRKMYATALRAIVDAPRVRNWKADTPRLAEPIFLRAGQWMTIRYVFATGTVTFTPE